MTKLCVLGLIKFVEIENQILMYIILPVNKQHFYYHLIILILILSLLMGMVMSLGHWISRISSFQEIKYLKINYVALHEDVLQEELDSEL